MNNYSGNLGSITIRFNATAIPAVNTGQLLDKLQPFAEKLYPAEAVARIIQGAEECLHAGEPVSLHLMNREGSKTMVELVRTGTETDLVLEVAAFLKPSWESIASDGGSYINIFSSILQHHPAHLLLFDRRALLQAHSTSESLELTDIDYRTTSKTELRAMFDQECTDTLKRSVTEKRFMMLQVKDAAHPGKGVLKVFEPVIDNNNNILFVFLAIFSLEDLKPTENFVLNQFLAIESAMDGIALLDENGRYYYLNDTHVKMFGYETEQELIGKSWEIIYLKDEIQRIGTDLFPQLMANGKWSGQTLGVSKQGTPVYQDISLTTLPGGGMICVCRDVGQRKTQEEQLALNDRILRNTNSMILITDANRNIEWVNEAFTQRTGYSLEEIAGRKPGELLQGPETDLSSVAYMRDKLVNNEPFVCETVNYTKQGVPYWIEIRCQPLFGKDGQVEKYFAIEEDITFKKNALEEVRKSQMLLEMALETSGNAVWEWDVHGPLFRMLNFHQMLGFADGELQPTVSNYLSLIHPDDLPTTLQILKSFREPGQETFEYQEKLRHKNGEYIWVLHRSKVVARDTQGNAIRMVGNTINITPLKKIEERLVKSENRWKNAVEGSGAGIGEIDFENQTIWFSQKAAQLLGYERAEELDHDLIAYSDRIHPDDREAVFAKLKEHLQGKIPTYEYEYRLKCKDGQYRWFDFHGIISRRDRQGNAVSFIGSAYDITDRKLFEEKLKLSEERWKFAIDGAKAGVYDWNIAENTVYYSDQAKELHGIFDEGNVFRPDIFFEKLIYKEDIPLMEGEVRKVIEGKADRVETEYRSVHPILGLRWMNDRAMVVQRDSNGVATRIIGIYFDITERKMLEEKIRESEQRWIFALEGSSSGVWDYNLNTGEVFYSNKLKELMGYAPGDPFENTISQFNRLVHPEDREAALEMLRQYLNGSIPAYENEQRALHRDGTYHWYLNKGIIASRDENGIANRVIGTVADITSRKKNELELIKAKELAEASAKAKRAFLANMSHEIRTPMNAILGLSEQVRQTALTHDQQFLMNIINEAAKSLQVLIDDILDFTKIEEGHLKMEHITFDLSELLKRTVSLLLHKAQEKNISIRLDYDWRVSSVINGDPNRLNQILINIVGNAIKFTSEGYVKLSCNLKEKKGTTQWIEFVISDTGIGMADDTLNNLFKEFYQEDQTIARKYGGTGLGLSITRNLVHLMNGTIRVESKKQVGTKVYILLPFEISSRKFITKTKDPAIANLDFFSGKRILLVEDNKVNRIVASIILKKMKMQIDEAENGKAALYLLEENAYDIILMDLQMPELDGISATEIIRNNGLTTPIIALTANAIQEELDELSGKGFNGYVIKPFEETRLLEKMQEVMRSGEQSSQSEIKAPVYLRNPKKDIGQLIRENTGGDPEIEISLVSAFKHEISTALEDLEQAVVTSDLEQIKRVAHKQKSMLLSLGLKDDSRSILFLSKIDVSVADPAEVIRKCRSLIRFFRKIYARVLELYPENAVIGN